MTTIRKIRFNENYNPGFHILSEIIDIIFQLTFCESSLWRWVRSCLGKCFVCKMIDLCSSFEFHNRCMMRVVLECKLNDNTVNERFKSQCSIDVKNTTFRAYTRYQVTRNQSSQAKRRQDSTDRKECKMRRDVA